VQDNTSTYLLDLRDVVRSLVSEVGEPTEVWLFGSREQETGSKRSDVDLLLVDSDGRIGTERLISWRSARSERQPLDLFISRNGRVADSIVNGSVLRDEKSLSTLLGARLLWSRHAGLVDDPSLPWVQEFRSDVNYQMTIVPTDYTAALQQLPHELERLGLPNTLLGTDWGTVLSGCADILARSVDTTTRLLGRAKGLTRAAAYPNDEYDAQNLFFLVLRPWLPDMEQNPFEIKYAGQKKYADLAACQSKLIIEIKYVSDASAAAAVTKQLQGLIDFYGQVPQAQALLFMIIVTHGAQWDAHQIDYNHTNLNRRPVVMTRSVLLPSPPSG
jgi:predicted nucleotidyltransferase